MNIRNEIKAYIVREGFTMSELVEKLAEQYGWSPSVPNLSDCQRQFEIVRKRRRNFVVFRRGGQNQLFPCRKRVFTICCFWRINSLRSFRR